MRQARRASSTLVAVMMLAPCRSTATSGSCEYENKEHLSNHKQDTCKVDDDCASKGQQLEDSGE